MRLYGSESAITKPIFNIKYFPYININNISLYENGYHDLLDKSNNGVIPAYKSVYTELASDKLTKTFIAIMFSGLDENDFLGSINENEFLIITNSYKLDGISIVKGTVMSTPIFFKLS